MERPKMDEWLPILAIIVVALCLFGLGFVFGRETGAEEAPAPGAVGDTAYVQLTPDFIEAFRLQCFWVPREEEK